MEFRLYIYLRYKKTIKFISGLIRYINAYKILIALPYCQLLIKLEQVFEYNIINSLNLLWNNNKKDIREVDINKQKSATLKLMP